MAIRFEVGCLCSLRKIGIILLTAKIQDYYNGFILEAVSVLHRGIEYSQSRGYIRKVIYSGG